MGSSSSSSDSSDEEIAIAVMRQNVHLKNENYVQETIPSYSDEIFKQHFRISRRLCEALITKYENSVHYLETANGKYGQLDANHQIVTYLWFMGHQTASFRDVADRFDCSISTLFNILRKVTTFLSEMAGQIITWPTAEECIGIEQNFAEKGFPGVIGAIDGCHIKIDKPAEDPDSYINRKHYYSVQMQVICDHERRIRDVFIGYPGSVHDSRVFRISPLAQQLPRLCGQNYYILGDSGYPCTYHLLTPYKDRGNLTPVQRNYNHQHAKSRYVIEHCFGILKQKFRQLYHLKFRKMDKICHSIRAACVLHNIALDEDLNEELLAAEEAPIGADLQNDEAAVDDRDGIARRHIVASMLPQR